MLAKNVEIMIIMLFISSSKTLFIPFFARLIHLLVGLNRIYCSLNCIRLQNPLQLNDFGCIDQANTYLLNAIILLKNKAFPYTSFQSIGISIWFKIPGNINLALFELEYTNKLTEKIITSNGDIQFNTLHLLYGDDTWGYLFAQVDYFSGNMQLYYAGMEFQVVNGTTSSITNTYHIIKSIYVIGDLTHDCGCLLSQIYLIPNNYITSSDQIYSLAGGDIELILWYLYDISPDITDLSNNQINVNPLTNTQIQGGYAQFTGGYMNAPFANVLWFTELYPSLTISFQFKFDTNQNQDQIPIFCRLKRTSGACIFIINLNLQSGMLDSLLVSIMGTSKENEFPGDYIIDNNWHYCMIQVLCINGNSGAYQYARVDNQESNWVFNTLNQSIYYDIDQPGYEDSSDDEFFIGRTDISPATWALKDLRIYHGTFRFNSIKNCNVDLGGLTIRIPDLNSLYTTSSSLTCLECPDSSSIIIDNEEKFSYCNQQRNEISCPIGSYLNNKLCINCYSSCNSCKSPNMVDCLTCNQDTYFFNGSCINNCPLQYYPDNNNQCQPCAMGCKVCQNSPSNCLTCLDTYYLSNTNCLIDCPLRTYKNLLDSTCTFCNGNQCATCQNSSLCCTSCFDGYYLNTQTNTCNTCSSNCMKCLEVDHNCIECISSINSIIYVLDTNQSNPSYKYCRLDIKPTQGQLNISEYDTLDIYLTFNFTLSSANIPDLDKTLRLEISDLTNGDDYSYTIIQISNTNITFRLNPNQIINHNILTVIIQDPTHITDSNNQLILSTINNITLRFYNPLDQIGLSPQIMLVISTSVIIGSFPMIISEGLSALWGLIDILQYLFYFIYLDMKIPIEFKKTLLFFKIATIPLPNIPAICFDILHKYWNIISLPELQAQPKFDEFDIDALFIRTGLGYLIYILMSFGLLFLMIGIEKMFYKYTGLPTLKGIIKMMKWSYPIRFILINIIQLSFTIFLQFTNLSFDNGYYITSNLLAILSSLFLILFLIWSYRKINSYLFVYGRLIFEAKYGILTQEFVNSKTINYITQVGFLVKNQIIIQIIKKIIYIFGFVILYDHVMINLIFIMLQSLIMIFILTKYSPYIRKSFNIKNIIQEGIFILIALILILINKNIIKDEQQQLHKISDYFLVISCYICFGYNLSFVVIDEIIGIKLIIRLIKGYYKKHKNNQKRRLARNHLHDIFNRRSYLNDDTLEDDNDNANNNNNNSNKKKKELEIIEISKNDKNRGTMNSEENILPNFMEN